MKKEYFASAAAVLSAFSLLLSGCSGASHNAVSTDGFPLTQQTVGNKSPESESSESAESSASSEDVTTPDSTDVSEPTDVTSTEEPVTVPSTDAPEEVWTETPMESTVMYVNTSGVYSRKKAIMGSEKVTLYALNDAVTVVAYTDTDYFKLDDGNFIHKDYLSGEEIVTTTTEPLPEGITQVNGVTYVNGIMIANKTYSLPADFAPGVQPDALAAFYKMQHEAAAEGINLYIISGFRSYELQTNLYNNYCTQDGKAAADRYSARPGHSEHQTGYAFDLNSLEQSFENTAEGKLLAANCQRYGFIIRYPKGKEEVTGYMYEPWHVRYLGEELAQTVCDSGLTLEEYLGITSVYAD